MCAEDLSQVWWRFFGSTTTPTIPGVELLHVRQGVSKSIPTSELSGWSVAERIRHFPKQPGNGKGLIFLHLIAGELRRCSTSVHHKTSIFTFTNACKCRSFILHCPIGSNMHFLLNLLIALLHSAIPLWFLYKAQSRRSEGLRCHWHGLKAMRLSGSTIT